MLSLSDVSQLTLIQIRSMNYDNDTDGPGNWALRRKSGSKR